MVYIIFVKMVFTAIKRHTWKTHSLESLEHSIAFTELIFDTNEKSLIKYLINGLTMYDFCECNLYGIITFLHSQNR